MRGNQRGTFVFCLLAAALEAERFSTRGRREQAMRDNVCVLSRERWRSEAGGVAVLPAQEVLATAAVCSS